MPTHPLLPFVESPDGLGHDILITGSASMPGTGTSMTPQCTASEKAVLQTGGSAQLLCMFCDQTFAYQEELGPHVLTQHPTTLFEPAVLRVEAEFRIPGARPKPVILPLQKEEMLSCIVCSQISQDASELETHMRKHKDYFTYGCNICGRRFREPWFLKNHMKMHGNKAGARGKGQQDLDVPVTINDVIQDQTQEPFVTPYKMCMVCGFFFPDQESLVEHSKVHNREMEYNKEKDQKDIVAERSSDDQKTFLQVLQLQPCTDGNFVQADRSSRSIAQLDPFNTYQAWQLATKGKIAVGPNNAKDQGQDPSTDNEDSCSDKEELSSIWSEGQGDKAVREVHGRELRRRQQNIAETPSPEPDQRLLMRKDKDKERPTTCEECGRAFRTYHQLVLHSRVHKRERAGEESPTASIDEKLPRTSPLDRAEEGSEDSYEDAATAENLGPDGCDRSKIRGITSRECNYCGKTFRSSYYLNVHLRTHTGEKPFKCVYCDYAAAQKTSLKYHLERRHKDKPCTDIPSRPVPSMPSPNENEQSNDNKSSIPSRSKLWVPGPRSGASVKPEYKFNSTEGKVAKPITQVNAEYEKLIAKTAYSPVDDVHIKFPVPVNLKMKKEIKEESFEAPLNLSFKVSPSVSPNLEPRNAPIPIDCSFCMYKTLYPEVLIMHNKLTHKDKSDINKKTSYRSGLKPKRYTGCPPALNGKDVAPFTTIERIHRRTKSPTPQPTKPQAKASSCDPHIASQWPPSRAAQAENVQESRGGCRTIIEPSASQGSSKFTEIVKEPNSRYVMGRLSPSDRVGIGERSYPVGSGVIWPSDAARLCLSSRFGNLPHMDLGEPSIKRLKYSMPLGRETSTVDKSGFKISTLDRSNRLLLSGRNVKTSSRASSPSELHEAFGAGKALTPPPGASIDNDWNMLNLLHSYCPSDFASLYHGTVANPSHGGLVNSRPGSRSTLCQQLPNLPTLQRRDHSTPIPNEHYGTSDKSS